MPTPFSPLLFSLLVAAFPPPAAAVDPEPAIRETIGHYFRAGDTASSAELRRAFHPATMMFSVAKDGAVAGVSQPEWWARLDANRNPTAALSRKITLLGVEGNAAIARVVSEYPEFRFEDYMTLLEIDGTWKIVGKIFHRTEPVSAPPAAEPETRADREAIRAVLATAAGALDGTDPQGFASAFDRRAMSYALEAGALVGVSLPEQDARAETRRKAGAPRIEESHRIVVLDSSGNAAAGKIESERAGIAPAASNAPSASARVDYALLLKVDGKWRIVGVVSAARKAAGEGPRDRR